MCQALPHIVSLNSENMPVRWYQASFTEKQKSQEDMQIAQVLTAANSRAEIWGQIPYGFHPAMLPYENTVLVPSGKETGTRDHQPCANYFETYPCVPHLLQFQLHQHADNLPNSMGPLQRTIKSPPLQLHKSGAWGWKHYEIPSIWHPSFTGKSHFKSRGMALERNR